MATLILGFGAGVALLVVGADRLVAGASGLARRVGVSTVVIGLTVVALGTSTPELFVSAVSAIQGKSDIAVGNVVGSNIGNLLLILGMTGLLMPMAVSRRLRVFDSQIMLAAAALFAYFSLDGTISREEGIFMLAGLVAYLIASVKITGPSRAQPSELPRMKSALGVIWIVVGLVALIVGSQLVLTSAVTLAQSLGLSERVIGLTIVAVGTSLPEIATSLMAARRRDADMSVANIVGSNILNVLAILGLSSVLAPTGLDVSQSVRMFDIPIMLLVSALVIPLFWTHGMITRLDSLVLVLGYALYVSSLLIDSTEPGSLRVIGLAAGAYGVFSAFVVYRGVRLTLASRKAACTLAEEVV